MQYLHCRLWGRKTNRSSLFDCHWADNEHLKRRTSRQMHFDVAIKIWTDETWECKLTLWFSFSIRLDSHRISHLLDRLDRFLASMISFCWIARVVHRHPIRNVVRCGRLVVKPVLRQNLRQLHAISFSGAMLLAFRLPSTMDSLWSMCQTIEFLTIPLNLFAS